MSGLFLQEAQQVDAHFVPPSVVCGHSWLERVRQQGHSSGVTRRARHGWHWAC